MLTTKKSRYIGLGSGIILLFIFICSSVVYGYTQTPWMLAIDAFRHFDGSNEHIIIKTVRLPRALIGAAVGASLGIAGAIMQALTRNPLASPGILGVNAGASLAIVIAVSFFSITSLQSFAWIAFLGAGVAAVCVYLIGAAGKQGVTPVTLTLAGAAIAALLSSVTQGILVLNESALDVVLYWLAGSVQGRKLDILQSVLPYLAVAWLGALLIGGKINILLMGEDLAKGLGQRTAWVKALSAVIVILLAGGSVAIAGPIGFIGIVVPHLARFFVGNDYRWVIPYCGVLGGSLLVVADIGSRYIIMPQEVPVGIITAFLGVPFFILIARKGGFSS
ncbi:FecCD family ABC transporter permease [Bacillus sp. 2205SS5-2]|uniref:FecCD family ABC transporter permease n=1 Tax=Bacillus sp. 2205SS5-2 TaxID=3109031 RepID=UPI00300646D1